LLCRIDRLYTCWTHRHMRGFEYRNPNTGP
jgi:hypothetical protein